MPRGPAPHQEWKTRTSGAGASARSGICGWVAILQLGPDGEPIAIGGRRQSFKLPEEPEDSALVLPTASSRSRSAPSMAAAVSPAGPPQRSKERGF